MKHCCGRRGAWRSGSAWRGGVFSGVTRSSGLGRGRGLGGRLRGWMVGCLNRRLVARVATRGRVCLSLWLCGAQIGRRVTRKRSRGGAEGLRGA